MGPSAPGDEPLFFGTRDELRPSSSIAPVAGVAHCTPNIDAAIWAAELADGDAPPRVYRVTATGPLEDAAAQPDYTPPRHPAMSWRCRSPLLVVDEVTEWRLYHGTRAALAPGDLLAPGHAANFGPAPRTASFIYFARTLDAAIWGAELAAGEGPGRIYVVEPTGPWEDDPNVTDKKFRGNPTKSFRSRAPLRVLEEHTTWEGHPPEVVQQMKVGIARLNDAGVVPEDD